jgi:predicted esterase
MLNRHTLVFKFVVISAIFLLLNACGSNDDVEVPNPVVSPAPDSPTDTPVVIIQPASNIPPVQAPGENSDGEVFEGLVNILLSVTLPENTPIEDNIYVSGDFEGWSGGGDPAYALVAQTDGTFQLAFEVDAGSTIQFKVTRGRWGTEEVSEIGRTIGNRVLSLRGDDFNHSISVQNWVDLAENLPNPYAGYWNTPTPDYSTNDLQPVLSLVGQQTQLLDLGESYIEEGAVAIDPQDGDISTRIAISGVVDTSNVGDYIVRYQVSDTQNNSAIALSRIVRVSDGRPSSYSVRPVGETNSHLGFMEQLPADYGNDPDIKYPVLIYHHGGGGDASSINDTPTNALLTLFSLGGGPISLAMSGDWNPDSPLIALSPQRSSFSPPNFERIDAFVDFAIANYQIDPNRIYMTGHSQGGFVSWRYATDHPNKVAAIAPLAGGFFAGGIPSNICDAAVVPIWAFHSIDDNIVSLNTGRQPIDLINNCPSLKTAAKFTTFDGLGHQSHQYVLSLQGMGNALPSDTLFDKNLYLWMMEQNKNQR